MSATWPEWTGTLDALAGNPGAQREVTRPPAVTEFHRDTGEIADWHGDCFSSLRTGIQPAAGNPNRQPTQLIDTPPPVEPAGRAGGSHTPKPTTQGPSPPRSWSADMLRWSLIFLIVALLAGLFGFTEIYAPAMMIAKVLFFVFLVLFVVSLLMGSRTTRDVV
jgi:uncharacterized membrane protein YtjA (UPF0391 family)